MDYTTLVATIKSYTEDTFPETPSTGGLTSTQQIDTFIKQAERRAYNSAQALVTRKQTTGTCVSGTSTIATPADWMTPFSVSVVSTGTTRIFLIPKEASFIYEAFPDPTYTNIPGFYAMQDHDTILLGPTPASNYTVHFDYYYYPESIVTASTTWLGNNFEDVLLYGALLEAAAFMKSEEDTVALYQKRYDEALAMLKQYAEGKHRQDSYRTAPTRYPVK